MSHILEEMDFLAKYCSIVGIQTLMADEVLRRACVKSLEIIGEASRNISDDLKIAHHHYFGVDWEIVDDALKNELPEIRLNLIKLLI